jgi:hypothetical protein
LLAAPRRQRHGFSNPHDVPARMLGLWSPAGLGLAFMRHVGRGPSLVGTARSGRRRRDLPPTRQSAAAD